MQNHLYQAGQAQASRKETDWGQLCWLANREIGNAEGLTFGRVRINRGKSNPRHRHDNCEEVLYLLAGKLDHSLGDDSFVLEPGDTLIIPPNTPHAAVSIGAEDADMIVAYNSAERGFQLEG